MNISGVCICSLIIICCLTIFRFAKANEKGDRTDNYFEVLAEKLKVWKLGRMLTFTLRCVSFQTFRVVYTMMYMNRLIKYMFWIKSYLGYFSGLKWTYTIRISWTISAQLSRKYFARTWIQFNLKAFTCSVRIHTHASVFLCEHLCIVREFKPSHTQTHTHT